MGDEMKHKHLDQDSRTLSHELECSLLKLDSVQQEKKKFRLKTASVFKLWAPPEPVSIHFHV